MSERRAPVQGDGWRGEPETYRPRGTIAWWEHEAAAAEYNKRWSQSAETLAHRGGFGWRGLVEFLGHEPTTWQANPSEPAPVVTPSAEGEGVMPGDEVDEIGAPELCRDHTQVVANLLHLVHVTDRTAEDVAAELSRQHCKARGEL